MGESRSAPIIGITVCRRPTSFGSWQIEADVVPSTYAKAIESAGGKPLLLPAGSCDSLLKLVDGLVVAGGPDIDPEMYGEQPCQYGMVAHPEQDRSEAEMIRCAIKNDIPLLGICRGMQLMSVIHGGKLHQHLPETPGFEQHGGWDGEESQHGVIIDEGSSLHQIMGSEVTANSTHHQGVCDPGSLTVCAHSSHDGLIEGVERTDKRFCLGVQWHPERIGHIGLFSALVEAARASRELHPNQGATARGS